MKKTDHWPHVVILGGGFGGLYAARALQHASLRVTLIDRRNHHLFQPLLYQVATATLNPSNVAAPLRMILRRQKNTTVILAEATSIDRTKKKVILNDGEVSYDYLIMATGATPSYFSHDEWAKHAPGLKSIEDALEIRKRIFLAFEKAEREHDLVWQQEWLTFVVIGGGPTGVELAGALAEISRHTLIKDFRNINPAQARILLIEAASEILPTFPDKLARQAAKALRRLGVEIRANCRVTKMDENGLWIGSEYVCARTMFWAAGVRASPIAQSLQVPLDRIGRVLVQQDLTIPGHTEVFVIGDLAAFQQDGQTVPGLAPVAMQQGCRAAENILRALDGKPTKNFRYADKGLLTTIGRGSAVASFGRLQLNGFVAWILWVLVHIYFLIGFRNRLFVMLEWAWHYLTFWCGARLITGERDANKHKEGT